MKTVLHLKKRIGSSGTGENLLKLWIGAEVKQRVFVVLEHLFKHGDLEGIDLALRSKFVKLGGLCLKLFVK